MRHLEEESLLIALYVTLVLLFSLHPEGTCSTEHVASNTAGTTAGRVLLLPNLQGELLAEKLKIGHLSLSQMQLL